jgi:hypothetical protein
MKFKEKQQGLQKSMNEALPHLGHESADITLKPRMLVVVSVSVIASFAALSVRTEMIGLRSLQSLSSEYDTKAGSSPNFARPSSYKSFPPALAEDFNEMNDLPPGLAESDKNIDDLGLKETSKSQGHLASLMPALTSRIIQLRSRTTCSNIWRISVSRKLKTQNRRVQCGQTAIIPEYTGIYLCFFVSLTITTNC